jgi:hypothetical protein
VGSTDSGTRTMKFSKVFTVREARRTLLHLEKVLLGIDELRG